MNSRNRRTSPALSLALLPSLAAAFLAGCKPLAPKAAAPEPFFRAASPAAAELPADRQLGNKM